MLAVQLHQRHACVHACMQKMTCPPPPPPLLRPCCCCLLPAGEPLLTEETIEYVTQVVAQHGSDAWWRMEIADLLPEHLRGGACVGETQVWSRQLLARLNRRCSACTLRQRASPPAPSASPVNWELLSD